MQLVDTCGLYLRPNHTPETPNPEVDLTNEIGSVFFVHCFFPLGHAKYLPCKKLTIVTVSCLSGANCTTKFWHSKVGHISNVLGHISNVRDEFMVLLRQYVLTTSMIQQHMMLLDAGWVGPSSSTSSLIVCEPSVAVACITAELIARNILRHPEKYMG